MKKRLRLIIKGGVHGVGFRYFVEKRARALDIKGHVKNLEDRTIEVIAEGEEDNLKNLIHLCQKGPVLARVQSVYSDWSDYINEYEEFKIN